MLTPIRDAVILYNPASGRGRHRRSAEIEDARRILQRAEIETELVATSGEGDAAALARKFSSDNRGLLVVCGGDGTINEAVNGIAGSRLPLAVLPAGTANVLAKELNLPWDIPEAARRIPGGHLARIALGRLSTRDGAPRFFVSVAGAGPDGEMIHALSLGLKHRTGQLAYWAEGFRQLFRYGFPWMRVLADDEELVGTLAIVGRTKHYGGPFRITTEASLFEEKFELAVIQTRSQLRYLSFIPALWLGRLRSNERVRFRKATTVRCEPPAGGADIYSQADGELVGRLPAEFDIVPDALTLVLPAGG